MLVNPVTATWLLAPASVMVLSVSVSLPLTVMVLPAFGVLMMPLVAVRAGVVMVLPAPWAVSVPPFIVMPSAPVTVSVPAPAAAWSVVTSPKPLIVRLLIDCARGASG